jgi:hypothetical protein
LVFTLSFALGGALVLEQPLCYYRHHAHSLHNPTLLDAATQRRRMAALGFRLKYLPTRLAELGVPPDVVEALMEPRQIEYDRTKLQFGDQSGRWNVFRTEWRRFRASYKRPSVGYRAFQYAVGACALALPPRQFYRLLDWYGRNNLKRFRNILGEPEPIVPSAFVRRRPIADGSITVWERRC